jgi:peptide alpha-N-acetyltransferase
VLTIIQAVHPETKALVGVVINKLEPHQSHSPSTLRGYIAMLAVSSAYRNHGIATTLVRKAIDVMIERNADEVVLETEVTNTAAMKLYERLGFLRSKKLHRYYLNGNTAYRLVLQLKSVVPYDEDTDEERENVERADGRPLLDDPPSA